MMKLEAENKSVKSLENTMDSMSRQYDVEIEALRRKLEWCSRTCTHSAHTHARMRTSGVACKPAYWILEFHHRE